MTHTQANEPGFVLVPGTRWRHRKRGTTYELIGAGKMQADDWFVQDVDLSSYSADDAPIIAYRSESDGSLWTRPVSEFCDGRFEQLAAAPIVPAPAYGVKEALEPLARLGGHLSDRDRKAGLIHRAAFWDCPADLVLFEDRMGASITVGDVRRARTAYDALSSAPVEEADAKAGAETDRLPSGHVVLEQADTLDGRVSQTVRVAVTGAEYERVIHAEESYGYGPIPPTSTIPSEPEAKGDHVSVELMQRIWANLFYDEDDAGFSYQGTLNDVVDWLAARGALPEPEAKEEAGAGPVGEAVAVRDWLLVAKAAGEHGVRYRTNRALEGFLSSVLSALTRPVEEPGEVERITRERDEAVQNAQDLALDLASAYEKIAGAKTAEAALAETRERLEKVEAAATSFFVAFDAEPEKDCWDTETGEEEEGATRFASDWAWADYHKGVEKARNSLRAALSTQESSAALAGDGKEAEL